MNKLRAISRLFLFAGLLGLTKIRLSLCGRPAPGRPRRDVWRHAAFKFWARNARRVMGARCHVVGRPPQPPFLLVSNHLSYVDIIILASLLDARFIAKQDVSDWGILGPMINDVGTIFVDRKQHRDLVRVNEAMGAAFRQGQGVVFFPEGTSSPGHNVLPFKSSLFDCSARQGYPVHYASISYRTSTDGGAADEAVSWWGDMAFMPHFMQLLEIPRIHVSVVFGDEPVCARDRKVLAGRLHQLVKENFMPVIGGEITCRPQNA